MQVSATYLYVNTLPVHDVLVRSSGTQPATGSCNWIVQNTSLGWRLPRSGRLAPCPSRVRPCVRLQPRATPVAARRPQPEDHVKQ